VEVLNGEAVYQSRRDRRPQSYSHAVKKGGTPVFIAGQAPLDPHGTLVGEGDIAAQLEQVYQNLRTMVEACGGAWDDIMKLTYYTTDLAHGPAFAAARKRHFTDPYPPSTFLVASSLASPRFLVEIEAVLMID
jgi:enamine deaminase RidA (YjgF/YER057c/UK114 family)